MAAPTVSALLESWKGVPEGKDLGDINDLGLEFEWSNGGAKVKLLAPAPPPAFVERLTNARIPLSVGHSIVATISPHEHEVLAAIRDLEMEWHVIFNKGSVMALPANVTKATEPA